MAFSAASNSVDLWQWRLDQACWDERFTVLDPSEQERASRFRGLQLQLRYRRCRTLLRLILSRYLAQPPEAINIVYNPYGKPELVQGALHFNLSHSSDVVLLAVSQSVVGADIEASVRTDCEVEPLMDWVCHADEKQRLASLPPAQREAAFYRLWTQKEAYCKALGNGLQQELTAIRFTCLGSKFAAEDANRAQPPAFFVHSVPAPLGYLASVCTPILEPSFRTGVIGAKTLDLEAAPSIV